MFKPDTVNRPRSCTVAVAEPNDVVRLGLAAMLWALESVTEVVALASAGDGAEELRSTNADVVLASCSLESEVLDDIQRWADERGAKVLLVISSADDPRLPEFARRAADGLVLLEGLTVEHLGGALATLGRGGQVAVPARLARQLIFGTQSQRRADFWHRNLLTQRETDILQLLSQGYSNKQIAPRIGISEHGVKRHVGNILAKLNCSNRTEAVSYALRQNLLTAAPAAG
ncbi:response regulator transcription factor [Catenulispora pinistramenti]|uniref:response regulator transcription factor n=1 Tax=Catenulispora pinistramenti TaxID=2705254 RepID=UPI001BA4DF8C|nr:response regulator transcription factor [Catenulispora pinistramenti]